LSRRFYFSAFIIAISANNKSAITAIIGGDAVSEDGNASAERNFVRIAGPQKVGMIVGGNALSEDGNAFSKNNRVYLDSGSSNIIWGGVADSTSAAEASYNEIFIADGAVVTDDVIAGRAKSQYGNASALYNSVTITGNPNLDTARLVGVYAESSGGTNASIGNALTVRTANLQVKGQGMQGVTLYYEFDILTRDERLLAVLSGHSLNERTKALSEGFIAGVALLNQGADLVAGRGLENAVVTAARASGESGFGYGAFGVLSGGFLRHNTGFHVDMRSLSLMAGLSLGAQGYTGKREGVTGSLQMKIDF
jgi:hypothetical protein